VRGRLREANSRSLIDPKPAVEALMHPWLHTKIHRLLTSPGAGFYHPAAAALFSLPPGVPPPASGPRVSIWSSLAGIISAIVLAEDKEPPPTQPRPALPLPLAQPHTRVIEILAQSGSTGSSYLRCPFIPFLGFLQSAPMEFYPKFRFYTP
jgi:hypothetical protein